MAKNKHLFAELASELRNIEHCVNFMIDYSKHSEREAETAMKREEDSQLEQAADTIAGNSSKKLTLIKVH